MGEKQKKFAKWQESSRKDIERAFGVLQGSFHIVSRQMFSMDFDRLSWIVTSVIILHNMRVEEFVSGNDRYKPDNAIYTDECLDVPDVPPRVVDKMSKVPDNDKSKIGENCQMIWRQEFSGRYDEMTSVNEHHRLQKALIEFIYSSVIL